MAKNGKNWQKMAKNGKNWPCLARGDPRDCPRCLDFAIFLSKTPYTQWEKNLSDKKRGGGGAFKMHFLAIFGVQKKAVNRILRIECRPDGQYKGDCFNSYALALGSSQLYVQLGPDGGLPPAERTDNDLLLNFRFLCVLLHLARRLGPSAPVTPTPGAWAWNPVGS